ncbi:MAG: hypothetical protein KDB61_00960 [Planctomycetes bacterium]|nr:hypothetical protein [Planctomycetota bacterium]
MTLIELLLAVLLASFVMVAIVRFVDVSLGLWSRAEDTRRDNGRGIGALQRLRQDLVSAHPGQVGDFLLEWQGFDLDGDKANDRAFPRLRFVRRPSVLDWRRLTLSDMSPEQRAKIEELGFGAGSAAAVQEESGDMDPELAQLGLATAPGLVETAWVLLPDPEADGDTAILYRAERKRLRTGERESFLSDRFVEANGSVESERLERVLGGVLWFSMELGTESTDPNAGVGVGLGQWRTAWDALGLQRPNVESSAQNETAVDRPMVEGRPLIPCRAHLVLELESERGRTRGPRLAEALDRETNTLVVSRGETLPSKTGTYLRIGSEWMRYVSRDGDRAVVERGQRGTLPGLHEAGAAVRFGHRSEAWVAIPLSRQEWQ